MSRYSFLLGISAGMAFVSAILFLLFSWITVRKLKKNPETKDALGFEYVSGWNTLNAAQALSLPRVITNKLKGTILSFLHADSDLLYLHTNKFDRLLARLFYITYSIAGLSMITLIILKSLGFFN
ncbi:MAG: hypothetical protein OEM38_10685 [Gammaproteobacteria bacterium]|nr:hypothetical protein [Gammaproteobacteria bacterium]